MGGSLAVSGLGRRGGCVQLIHVKSLTAEWLLEASICGATSDRLIS